ncbi:molybdate transport system regulatory protein [Chitinivorax tropicus]|uniref:Molybdate transport system regulatory protein n=1 Tax=Chitinivorax tropicus TaxID=714531 RepID=A0A840ML84_9PROT|nr:TOBE domain-containing protein [Chitinivorax tropicus]MBB5019408.1 molybdate transport system regulatory protein [Chitinivorax tropicus]
MKLHASLALAFDNQHSLSSARIRLLQAIALSGSISQAAKQVGLSYKAAWDAIDAINNLAGEALVQRSVGGKGGGGTQLTPRGQQLLATFQRLEAAHLRFLDSLPPILANSDEALPILQRLNMKTSARNQLFGHVHQIRQGAVNDEIILRLPGGGELVATITHESTEQLALQSGSEVVALIKASWVMLAVGQVVGLSTPNQLTGTISTLHRGAVNCEVVLALPGGQTIVAIITNDSADALVLQPGLSATALVQPAHIMLGLPN